MIGFYAHHHGTGHLRRCRTIAAAVQDETAVLSSAPSADVVLEPDAPAPGVSGPALDAHGVFHWAPAGHRGLARRMATIAQWVAEHEPRAFHVDVSVEVAVLVRAMGVPVSVQAMPGDRPDPVHALGYRLADAIIAAWPDWVRLPEHLRQVAERVHPVGGISGMQLDVGGTGGPGAEAGAGTPQVPVVILQGGGGNDQPEDYWDEVAARLGAGCRVLGPGRWVEDPQQLLARAEVVITAAGQNSVADLAVLGSRAVVVPQQRPFDEQLQTAAVLREAGLAVVPDSLPRIEQWPGLVAQAYALEPRWERWQTTGSARRAARVLEGLGR